MNNKKIINFKTDKKHIIIYTLESVKHVQFSFEVREVENFGDVLVVRLKVPVGTVYNENVFGVSDNGKILWQIEKLKYIYDDSPFTGMEREGDYIKLRNWDGTDLIVNPNTGKIISKGWSK